MGKQVGRWLGRWLGSAMVMRSTRLVACRSTIVKLPGSARISPNSLVDQARACQSR
jgi:hypothetical protein